MRRMARKTTTISKLIVCCSTEYIYEIWCQWNNHVFDSRMDNVRTTTNRILFRVTCRVGEIVANSIVI